MELGPMYTVKALTTTNYKNLHLQEGLQLGNLNVFIGPNGSGKSNLIDVLAFLQDAITDPVDKSRGVTGFVNAVARLGDFKILDGTIKSPARVKFKFEFRCDAKHPAIFELELLIRGTSETAVVIGESLYTLSPEKHVFYKCHDKGRGGGKVLVYNDPVSSDTHFEELFNVPGDNLTLAIIPELLESENIFSQGRHHPFHKVRRDLVNTISQWRSYNANNMNLADIRRSEPKIGPKDVFLSSSGENLPLVLYNLMQDHLDFEESINNAMKAILPSTLKIRAVHSGRLSLTVDWHVEGMSEPLYLTEMSDGTVRMLCWATILHSPELPSLLVIEEPELGIHVAWMQTLAEWIKQAAARTQIIVSTHSPDLLDHFTEQTENVFVFRPADQDKNHFQVQPLSPKNVSEWIEKGWQLGDLYRIGDPSVGGWPW